MKTIILTRHAETLENIAGVFQGKNHTDFSGTGKTSLRKLKRELDKYEFDLALSSDLPRCLKTAEYVLHQRQEILRTEPLIREKSSGQLAGQPVSKEVYDKIHGSFETKKPPDGESLIDVRNRAERFLELLKKLPGQRILVVSHGGFLKIFLGLLLGKDLRQSVFDLDIDHCLLTTVLLNNRGQFSLKQFNKTSHL